METSKYGRKCVVCKKKRTTGSNVKLSRIPLDLSRCRKWIKAIGQEDLIYLPIEKLHELKYVCSGHFLPDDYSKCGRLLKHAVPTQNLPKALEDNLFDDFPLHIGQYPRSQNVPECSRLQCGKQSASLKDKDLSEPVPNTSTKCSETERSIATTSRQSSTETDRPDEPITIYLIDDAHDDPTQQNVDPENTSEKSISTLPHEILETLGLFKSKKEIFAPKIKDEISERWEHILVNGLTKEAKHKLLENIQIPKNLKLLKAPLLNTEISAVLPQASRNRDKRLEKAQNHLGIGVAAIANLMSTLIDGELDKMTVIKKLSEVGQLLSDIHCQSTSARSELIMSNLDKNVSSMIQGVKRDTLLFGENLGEKMNGSKITKQSGLRIKRSDPQPSTITYRATAGKLIRLTRIRSSKRQERRTQVYNFVPEAVFQTTGSRNNTPAKVNDNHKVVHRN